MKKVFNFILHNRTFLSWVGMFAGTILYTFALAFIIELGDFYTGGVTGLCQIISTIIKQDYSLTPIFVAVANIPLFLLGFKKVSKRFAILSLASVLIQILTLSLFQYIRDQYNINFFKDILNFDENGSADSYGKFILAILGGIATGAGCAISLKYGASTGGLDIISQAFSFKTNKSFASISFCLDICIVTLGMIARNGSLAVGLFTVIRLAMANITLDKIYKIYTFQKVTVITKHPDEMKEAFLAHFEHGITIMNGLGGYSNEPKFIVESVCLSYELEDYRRVIMETDPKAFVYYSQVKGIQGKFHKKAIN